MPDLFMVCLPARARLVAKQSSKQPFHIQVEGKLRILGIKENKNSETRE